MDAQRGRLPGKRVVEVTGHGLSGNSKRMRRSNSRDLSDENTIDYIVVSTGRALTDEHFKTQKSTGSRASSAIGLPRSNAQLKNAKETSTDPSEEPNQNVGEFLTTDSSSQSSKPSHESSEPDTSFSINAGCNSSPTRFGTSVSRKEPLDEKQATSQSAVHLMEPTNMEIRLHSTTSKPGEISAIDRSQDQERTLPPLSSNFNILDNLKMSLHSIILNPSSPIVPKPLPPLQNQNSRPADSDPAKFNSDDERRERKQERYTEEQNTLVGTGVPDSSLSGKGIPTPPISRQSSQQSSISYTDKVSGFGRTCRTLPPPIRQPPQGYKPPEVVFTVDNRAESNLVLGVVQSFIDVFSSNSQLQLSSQMLSNPNAHYPIGTIMWQTLTDFCQWYCISANSSEVGTLVFELVDGILNQSNKRFVVPDGDMFAFRELKQNIWDCFWTARNASTGRDVVFKVRVETLEPGTAEEVKYGSKRTVWNAKSRNIPPSRSNSTSTNANVENISSVPRNANGRQLVRSPTQRGMVRSAHTSPNMGVRTETRYSARQRSRSFKNQLAPIQGLTPPEGRRLSLPRRAASANPPVLKRPYSPPHQNLRTEIEKASLREFAQTLLQDRPHLSLLPSESSTLDWLPYKKGAEVAGCIIDLQSAPGTVMITGQGYVTQTFATGPGENNGTGTGMSSEGRYQEVTIQAKQTCMLQGGAVVLYYSIAKEGEGESKNRTVRGVGAGGRKQGPQTRSAITNSEKESVLTGLSVRSSPSTSVSTTLPQPEISVRLQMSAGGHFSKAFPKSVLRPKLTTVDFWRWFAEETSGYAGVGEAGEGPETLRFTFKDSMPRITEIEVRRGDEENFMRMKRDIKGMVEQTMGFMEGGVQEWTVLVSVPEWGRVWRLTEG